MPRLAKYLAALLLLALSTWEPAFAQTNDFRGPVPRHVLENYLARSITFLDLLTEKGDFDDNLRMLDHVGAKFVGRSVYRWGHEADLPRVLKLAAKNADRAHAVDPDIVLQACLFEIVSPEVEHLPVPAWAFEALGLPGEERSFDYEAMLYADGKFHNHWAGRASVPDVSRTETKLWFYFLARSYIDCGNEWLRYTWDWVRRHDPSGHLQMPGSRILHAPVDGKHWYFANRPGDAVPDGFGQEETIHEIWAADQRNADNELPGGLESNSVACEGAYPRHLQGICTNDRDAIYWSLTDVLVKTGLDGKVVKQIPVANHHGDLCHVAGKLYAAVNLGQFNRPAGKADSWVYVYDAQTLQELARHETQEVVHGAGGIAHHNGRFIVVGGLPPGTEENYLYQYDESFRFVKRHVLDSGYTLMGIQTAAFAEGHWWFGCYGAPEVLLKADESFQLVGKWPFDCSLGITGLADGRFLVGKGKCTKQNGCTGALELAMPDEERGLKRLAAD